MSKLAKRVVLTRKGLVVDGEEFPYYIAAEDIEVYIEHEGMTTVTVRLLCNEFAMEGLQPGDQQAHGVGVVFGGDHASVMGE